MIYPLPEKSPLNFKDFFEVFDIAMDDYKPDMKKTVMSFWEME